jgi:proteic killer suppression protein
MVYNSVNISDLRIAPTNRIENLFGKLKDFYSMGNNDQWRIIFKWNTGNAAEVQITDYR